MVQRHSKRMIQPIIIFIIYFLLNFTTTTSSELNSDVIQVNNPPTADANSNKNNSDDHPRFIDIKQTLLGGFLEKKNDSHNSSSIKKKQQNTKMRLAVRKAAEDGLNAIIDLYEKKEKEILQKGNVLKDQSPGAMLAKFSAPTDDEHDNDVKLGFGQLVAAKKLKESLNLDFSGIGRQAPPRISLKRTALEEFCPPREPPVCSFFTKKYRTHDGTCNNQKRLRWGAAQMPFHRFMPPEYGDGLETFRNSISGGPLPSARFVSLVVHGDRSDDSQVTLMLPQWGQFIDHDLTSTRQPKSINGSVPSCCHGNELHPACMPIKVPEDDPWLSPLGVRCLEFLRSAPASRHDCFLSWREQTNQASSYLDGSMIYSSNPRAADNSRIFRDGLLVFGKGATRDDICRQGAIEHGCVRAGDSRNGEQPGLLAMHTVFVAEHNRIALQLSDLNFHWSDEKLYQETRRIIIAMIQHITFREFLPLVLGREVMQLFDLELRPSGFYSGYDPQVNPSVANAFSAAAFRFGHSMVQSSIMRSDANNNFIRNNVSLHEEAARGDMGGPGSLHRLLRGLVNQRAQRRDEFISAELTNHLFQTSPFPFGLDLAAINVQRGRDHGIPPFVAWRGPCGLSKIETWEDLHAIIGPKSVQRLRLAYKNVEDIDLFVGGLAERPVKGGLVGPTFACIIAQQFSNLRKGDRFWYENSGFESSFTPGQLQSIRQTSLAQIICRTLETGTLQPHVFLPSDFIHNQRKSCDSDELSPIDLIPWREHDPFNKEPNRKHDTLKTPESPFSMSNNEISNKLDLTRPLRPSESLTNDKLNEVETPQTGNKVKSGVKKTKATTKTTTTTTIRPTTKKKPNLNDKLDFTSTRTRNGTKHQITTRTPVSKRTKRKVKRTKRKTTKTTTEPSTTTTTTTMKTRRHDGWIVIDENDQMRPATTTAPRMPQVTNRRTTVRGWVLLENRKLKTDHKLKKRETDLRTEDNEKFGQETTKLSDLLDFDSTFEQRKERDLKPTTEKPPKNIPEKNSRVFPIRYNMLNKRLTDQSKIRPSINDKLDRVKASSVGLRLDWTRKTTKPTSFLNQDNATAYLRNHAIHLEDAEKQSRTNDYYLNNDSDEGDDHYRPVPIRIAQKPNDKTRRPIGFRNNMPIYDLTQTKIEHVEHNNYIHTVTSTLRPGASISYEVEIPLLSTKPTKVRIKPSSRPSGGYYGPSTTTSRPDLQTFSQIHSNNDDFFHETYSYRPPLRTTPPPISFVSPSAAPARPSTMDPLSFFMASTTALSSLYHDTPDDTKNQPPQHTVKVQSTFAAILGNNYPTLTHETSYDHQTDDHDNDNGYDDPDVLHIPPHLIPEVDEKYFFNDQNWEKVEDNKRHDQTTGYGQPSYTDYTQYNSNSDQKTKYYYVDNVLHKKDAYGEIYRKKGGRRYAESFEDKDNDAHWIRVTRDTDDKTNNKMDKARTLTPTHRRQQTSDTGFVSLFVLNSAERPDNWVNPDSISLRTNLPEMPFLPDERHTAKELPRPIRLNFDRKT